MRWFHREQAASSSSSPAPQPSPVQSPALHTLPSPSARSRNMNSTLDDVAPKMKRRSFESFEDDDNDNDSGSGPSHDQHHRSPQSLLIAPNLTALLEEDDRRRREEMGASASSAFDPSFSHSILGPFSDLGDSEPVQVGLPPPPRGPKKPVKPKQHPVGRSTSISSIRIGVGSGPHRSLLTSAERAGRGTGSSTTSSHSETNTMSISESHASTKETEAHNHAEQDSTPAARPTVDLGKTTPSSNMPFTLPPLQIRPLLTQPHHGHSDSIEVSSPSFSSASTHEPASTVNEPRISISSTIYPASYLYPDHTDSSSRIERENSLRSYSSGHQRRSTQDSDSKISVSEGFLPGSPRDVGTPISFKDSPKSSPYIGPSPTASLPRLDFGNIAPSPVSPYDVGQDSATTRSGGGGSSNQSVHTDSLRSRSGKPPLPTTPKPKFGRSISAHSSARSSKSASSSPTGSPKLASLIPYSLLTTFTKDDGPNRDNLPPTTNELNAQERAELIRKNRKLTQVLGQLPSAAVASVVGPESPNSPGCFPPMPTLPSKKTHLRGASLVSDFGVLSTSLSFRDRTLRSTLSSRGSADSSKLNSPLSPITFRDRDDVAGRTPISAATSAVLGRSFGAGPSSSSPPPIFSTDSEEEGDTGAGGGSAAAQGSRHRATLTQLHFPSTPSLTDSLYGPLYQDELDVSSDAVKRRKREKLAKLHRYLGSKVPPELAVGIDHRAPPLPAIAPLPDDLAALSDSEWGSSKKKNSGWKPRRRRSSSSAAFPPSWSEQADRIKEDLNEEEKAVNVKRALKMGKLFGEQPPQDLYHTRRSPSMAIAIPGAPHDIASAPATPLRRNPAAIDKSAYKRKTNKSNRPGTADSNTGLLSKGSQQEAGSSSADVLSDVYKHYRHSLNSLTDILDRDDKESLAQLHEYLNPESPDADAIPITTRTTITKSPSLRSERRRSLPSRPSISSLASEFTISPEHDRQPSGDTQSSAFQQRRRRAAKLSHFFGVNHRDLFGQVLDSLESGVKEEGGRGRLRPEEVNDLLHKLRKLKSRRDEISI